MNKFSDQYQCFKLLFQGVHDNNAKPFISGFAIDSILLCLQLTNLQEKFLVVFFIKDWVYLPCLIIMKRNIFVNHFRNWLGWGLGLVGNVHYLCSLPLTLLLLYIS